MRRFETPGETIRSRVRSHRSEVPLHQTGRRGFEATFRQKPDMLPVIFSDNKINDLNRMSYNNILSGICIVSSRKSDETYMYHKTKKKADQNL